MTSHEPTQPSRRSLRIPDAEVLRVVRTFTNAVERWDALRQAEAFAPLAEWGGSQPCVLAARLAANTGAPRLACS